MTTEIKTTKVSDKHRLAFLPKFFGKRMIAAENRIYNVMSKICDTYNGGYWNFYELSNGSFYMAPSEDKSYEIGISSNGYEGILSADAVGIVATLYVIYHFACIDESDQMVEQYYLLRDFAAEHSEANKIFAAID